METWCPPLASTLNLVPARREPQCPTSTPSRFTPPCQLVTVTRGKLLEMAAANHAAPRGLAFGLPHAGNAQPTRSGAPGAPTPFSGVFGNPRCAAPPSGRRWWPPHLETKQCNRSLLVRGKVRTQHHPLARTRRRSPKGLQRARPKEAAGESGASGPAQQPSSSCVTLLPC